MRTPNLKIDAIRSDWFTYEGDSLTFMAERSDLCDYNLFQQFFDDTPNDTLGFLMTSVKTGQRRYFIFSEESRDDDGEIISWKFKIVPENRNEIGVKAVIFND